MAERVFTKKGTEIRRYRGLVGKYIGGRLYVHRDYSRLVIPLHHLGPAESAFSVARGMFPYNCLMYDSRTDTVRFDEAPDFDTASEPRVGRHATVDSSGVITYGRSDAIWHHKWLWVKDDYAGFDVQASQVWSREWLSKIDGVAKGNAAGFEEQLARAQVRIPGPVKNMAFRS